MKDRHGKHHRPAGPGGGQFIARGNSEPASSLSAGAELPYAAQWHDPRFDAARADLRHEDVVRTLAHQLGDVNARDAALRAIWGASAGADAARFRFDWDTIMSPTATSEDLAIAGANPRVPVGALLRHEAADESVLQSVLPRVRPDDVRGGRLEGAYARLLAQVS